MADYEIEIKEQRLPSVPQQTGSSAAHHYAANVTASFPALNAWGDAIAADAVTQGAHDLWLVIHNLSTSNLAFAASDAATPTAYHVVLAGQSREVSFDPTVALRVKELA